MGDDLRSTLHDTAQRLGKEGAQPFPTEYRREPSFPTNAVIPLD
jgi:hypothetical protein